MVSDQYHIQNQNQTMNQTTRGGVCHCWLCALVCRSAAVRLLLTLDNHLPFVRAAAPVPQSTL